MFRYIEPVYEKNMILTAEVLQEHTDYAHNLVKNAYIDYSDGIISGVNIEITDAYIKVYPGLIKHNQVLYCLKKTVSVPYDHNGKLTFLRIRFLDPIEQEGGILYETEIVLTNDHTEFLYEMELGRFIASPGATLYKTTSAFSQLALQYDQFDIRFVNYAAVGVPTVSPVVTTLFARELLAKHTNEVYDVAFAMQCMSGQVVARDVILAYIQAKTGKKIEGLTNEQIYKELEQIIKQPVATGRFQNREHLARRVIVD